MLNKRKAFTLIELLVVIAIIAILAAILFPVFAQAKLSAKGAASISNTKQITMGVIMYGADYDDRMVPDHDWGNSAQDMLGWNWGAGECYASWGWLIYKYTKNAEIYQDPLITRQPLGWNGNVPVTYSEYPQYGYNWAGLSPVYGTVHKWSYDTWDRNPVASTAIPRPANFVMFTTKSEYNQHTDNGWWWPWSMWPAKYTVEGPDCAHIPQWCINGWGTGTWLGDVVIGKASNGAYTGGVTFRKSGQAIVGWVDGHVSTQTAGALAQGTNWNPNIAESAILMTDYGKHQWSFQ
jgi:prepilin-type N-terminal cleavage/methylation domain-containing protein/prepilin-type processing-associated H-X9-DG protein